VGHFTRVVDHDPIIHPAAAHRGSGSAGIVGKPRGLPYSRNSRNLWGSENAKAGILTRTSDYVVEGETVGGISGAHSPSPLTTKQLARVETPTPRVGNGTFHV